MRTNKTITASAVPKFLRESELFRNLDPDNEFTAQYYEKKLPYSIDTKSFEFHLKLAECQQAGIEVVSIRLQKMQDIGHCRLPVNTCHPNLLIRCLHCSSLLRD